MDKQKNDANWEDDPQNGGPQEEYYDPEVCPVCGSIDFRWGKLHQRWDSTGMGFRPDDAGMLDMSRAVRARQCLRCGNVQLFAELD
ncbi:hypothetical protein G4Y79_24185 [Phototrophicus methaneseepsis]|uniref:Uncharacterized protein n=1 Tax=Phototrophicus methaneseepsis TaxID=2710758 RepID=A0A7S8E9B4_9CHLR|nr:hypothetical protein [Phototrophicus methaneseepsis]QPC82745.1 hypothetical protein G4Y79_24185 [Phototrophicus methaneseepsis]